LSIRRRTVAVVSGAAIATVVASAVAFAAVDPLRSTGPMAHLPAHMADVDQSAMAEMHLLMDEEGPIGAMHRWMVEQGIDIGQMHRDLPRAGMDHEQMHRLGQATGGMSSEVVGTTAP
jgi:hypothetical protein